MFVRGDCGRNENIDNFQNIISNRNFITFLKYLINIFATLIVVTMLNYWMLLPTSVLVPIIFFLRHTFARTARPVTRFEALSIDTYFVNFYYVY